MTVNYTDYLRLPELLALQTRESERQGAPAHDEMLFIIIHQTYELWFKQILFELDLIQSIFDGDPVPEADLGRASHALDRILTIQRLLIDQVDILETMTPMDFLEFRNALFPASGFQSGQFRQLEVRLGLPRTDRLTYSDRPFDQHLETAARETVNTFETSPSLRTQIDTWLSRTPFTDMGDFRFQEAYQAALNDMLNEELAVLQANTDLAQQERDTQIASLERARRMLDALMDEARFEALKQDGAWSMSRSALQAALFINLYRDEPILQAPFRILARLMDLDEAMATWRYRHALMAYRMIGRKVGTGGSSGHDYLRQTAEKHRVFADLFAIATFLIPRSRLPKLPQDVRRSMTYTCDLNES